MRWRQSNSKGSAPYRTGHTATILNKKMYIFGGTGSGYYYNDMHVYDIGTSDYKFFLFLTLVFLPNTIL